MIVVKTASSDMGVPASGLFQPSLSGRAQVRAPYSTLTGFLTAFLGGPFGIIALTGLNSWRLLRLKRDLLLLIPATLITLVLAPALGLAGGLLPLRLYALCLFGLAHLLHRREQRTADLMGMDRPNGRIGGLACIVAGNAVLLAYIFLVAGLPKA